MYDFTYVENVAYAHICADRALASEKTVAERAAGQVGTYNIATLGWLYYLEGENCLDLNKCLKN